jgi:FkbM family methyltransferase
MKIYFGIQHQCIDVTLICAEKLKRGGVISIPSGDCNRSIHFTDPLNGVHKKIIIEHNDIITEYDEFVNIKINTVDNTIITTNELDIVNAINCRLMQIHSKLKMNHGNLNEEIPEQKMAIRFLTGSEKVLEIGGNVGRNTLVIASILENDANLVTLECDPDIATQLTENRDLNNFKFHIEPSALSNRKLIQKGWDTMPSEILITGFKWVNTVSMEHLKTKYNIEFDTLVLDCEGAFYYILMDMPDILNNINLIIMENDYHIMAHKEYVNFILTKNNFYVDYMENGGWGPCAGHFFEVWKKSNL